MPFVKRGAAVGIIRPSLKGRCRILAEQDAIAVLMNEAAVFLLLGGRACSRLMGASSHTHQNALLVYKTLLTILSR